MIPTSPTVRRKRWGLRIVLALVVVAGLLVVLDRVAVVVAERMAADTLQQSQQLVQRPDVSIDGFPFLTQLARRTFGRVEVGVDDVTLGRGGRAVTLRKLRVSLQQVHVSADFHRATARSGTASAVLGYLELSRVLGIRLVYAGSGRVAATASTTVAGVSVSGRVSAKPALGGAALRFTDVRATIDGASVPGAGAALAALLDEAVDLSQLPFGLHVRAFTAAADGVSITLTAPALTFVRPA